MVDEVERREREREVVLLSGGRVLPVPVPLRELYR